MKELFKSKAVLGMFVLMLGFVYIKSTPVNNLDIENNIKEDVIVYKNN